MPGGSSERAVALFALGLTAAAAATAVALVMTGHGLGEPLAILTLSGLALLAERNSIRLNATTEMSVSFLPLVFAAVVFGPLAAMFVGAVGLLTQFGQPHVRWVIWTASRMLVGAAAGMAASTVGTLSSDAFAILFAGAMAAAVTEVILDLAIGGATVRVRGTSSFVKVVRTQGPVLLAAIPLYTPVIAILAYAYHHLSPWSVALFLIPGYASQRLYVMYREQRELAAELAAVNYRLELANGSFATALVATLEARDRYTAGHSTAVSVYARDIAAAMRLSEADQRRTHLAGLVHDIGKIGLPPGLLEKNGPLNLRERRQMEKHSEIGERILSNVADYREIAEIVRHHHERVDGFGYPDGLVGTDIPLIARVIAVADAYNAMTSDRPYRDAMSSSIARSRLVDASGAQFDREVVAAFEAVLGDASEEYRSGAEPDVPKQLYRSTTAVAAVG